MAEEVVQVAGEPQPLLVGGEVGDGGAGLAQRDRRTDEFAYAGHGEAAEQGGDEQPPQQVLAVRHGEREPRHQRARAGDRPAGQPRGQRRAGRDGDVHEQHQPLAAQREREDGGLGGEHREGAEDGRRAVDPPGAEDQQHVPGDEHGEPEPAEGAYPRGVSAVQQVADGGAEVHQPDGRPQHFDGPLPEVPGTLSDVDADAAHAFRVSFRYSQAAPPVKSTKKTSRTVTSCTPGAWCCSIARPSAA